MYRITFSRNKIFGEIILRDKHSYNIVNKVLRRVTILNTFGEDYEIIGSKEQNDGYELLDASSKHSFTHFLVKKIQKSWVLLDKEKINERALLCEVKALKVVSNDHLEMLHEVHESADNVYLVMEPIKGPNVTTLNQLGKPIAEAFLVSIMRDLLIALRYMHNKSIIHRNMVPSNIYFSEFPRSSKRRAKAILTGLSSCCFYDDDPDPDFIGTYGFIAPEVLHLERDNRYVNRPPRDMWNLGALMYFMATKSYVFDSNVLKRDRHLIIEQNFQGTISLEHPYFKKLTPRRNINTNYS